MCRPGAPGWLAELPAVQALRRIWIQQYYRDGEKVIRREERVHGLDQLGVGDGTRLLDIAYGSGFAAQLAARRGAVVTGIDASDALVKIAGARTAEGDFRVGDMFALPFPGASFDVATSFNGIWKGCEAALREASRVLVPGGRLGLTFWGRLEHVGLMPYVLKTIELSPPSHGEATIRQGHTGRARRDRADAGLGGLRAARARDCDGDKRVARCRARGPGTAAAGPSVPPSRRPGSARSARRCGT